MLASVRRPQRRRRGFTILELLIVVAIIGIIAAILMPNLLEALNKSKQKRSMTDIRLIGTSWFSWVTDQVSASAAGATIQTLDWDDLFTDQSFAALETILVPAYAAFVPQKDAWGNEYEYGATESYNDHIPVGVRSTGAEGLFQSGEYTPGAFVATDFIQDIVWAGGYFVKWPSGHVVNTP
jgi:prepilin-type N-terminal cleavage/methylation domain-containing protein